MRLTCNGKPALRGRIGLSAGRGWTASLVLDADTFAVGPVTIVGGGATLVGYAWRAASHRATAFVRVCGGAGKIGATIPARAYRAASVRHIVTDILRDAGESLSAASSNSILDRRVEGWVRMQGSCGAALDVLCAALDTGWSVEDDGTISIGEPAWSAVQLGDEVQLSVDALGRRLLFGLETFAIRPGMSLGGIGIAAVDYVLEHGKTRAEVELVRH